ncbi:MAG: hypothetical protein DRI46_07990 [Chloroflexi bacterium]|nr:MAG: hypothetical protein DRI46_07990 [Chloroflexota bacterium]
MKIIPMMKIFVLAKPLEMEEIQEEVEDLAVDIEDSRIRIFVDDIRHTDTALTNLIVAYADDNSLPGFTEVEIAIDDE